MSPSHSHMSASITPLRKGLLDCLFTANIIDSLPVPIILLRYTQSHCLISSYLKNLGLKTHPSRATLRRIR
jgi:hypothetical protein